MAFLGHALLLLILPADACKQCDTAAGCHSKSSNNMIHLVYGNATRPNTAGRAPVPITVSPSKLPANMTRITHGTPQDLSGAEPHGTNVSNAVIVPESINNPPQVPLSCLQPDVTCTLKTTITSTVATKTVPDGIPIATSRDVETGSLAEGGHITATGAVKTDTPSPTDIRSDGSSADGPVRDSCTTGLASAGGSVTKELSATFSGPSVSTTSREKPVFSYDPINAFTSSTKTNDLVSSHPTTSASLDALSVLESALSALSTTVEISSSGSGQGSSSMFFPSSTEASDASSHTKDLPHDGPVSETTAFLTATYASSSASTIASLATSAISSDEEPSLHFTPWPTNDGQLSVTGSTSSNTELEVSLTYSPLQSITTTPSTPASSSGGVQSMSSVATPEQTGLGASGELPEVVQQSGTSESSSEASSTANAVSTDSAGEAESGSRRLIQMNGMALTVVVTFVLLMI